MKKFMFLIGFLVNGLIAAAQGLIPQKISNVAVHGVDTGSYALGIESSLGTYTNFRFKIPMPIDTTSLSNRINAAASTVPGLDAVLNVGNESPNDILITSIGAREILMTNSSYNEQIGFVTDTPCFILYTGNGGVYQTKLKFQNPIANTSIYVPASSGNTTLALRSDSSIYVPLYRLDSADKAIRALINSSSPTLRSVVAANNKVYASMEDINSSNGITSAVNPGYVAVYADSALSFPKSSIGVVSNIGVLDLYDAGNNRIRLTSQGGLSGPILAWLNAPGGQIIYSSDSAIFSSTFRTDSADANIRALLHSSYLQIGAFGGSTATLTSGTVTVVDPSCKPTSRITVSYLSPSGPTIGTGFKAVAGTGSFVITSINNAGATVTMDVSTVQYIIRY